MGREVRCTCRWGAQSGAVTALLESEEIIIRGAIKQRVWLAEAKGLKSDADGLHFTVGENQVVLLMGAAEAERWLKKVNTPPPSLRDKLGLGGTVKALVVGQVD